MNGQAPEHGVLKRLTVIYLAYIFFPVHSAPSIGSPSCNANMCNLSKNTCLLNELNGGRHMCRFKRSIKPGQLANAHRDNINLECKFRSNSFKRLLFTVNFFLFIYVKQYEKCSTQVTPTHREGSYMNSIIC